MPSVVAPWILSDLAELSWSLCAGLFLVGFVLFLLGGFGHRFWLVLGITLAAGIVGLQYGPQFGMQPLVGGLFLGISAGALALSLMRIAIFLAVGMLTYYIAVRLAPGWNEQVACFLAGGLVGVFFFRFWVMVTTSLVGTLLMTYSTLLMVARYGKVDVVSLTERNGPLFNWAVAGVALLGLIFQWLLLSIRSGESESGGKKDKKDRKDRKKKDREKEKDRDDDHDEAEAEPEKRGWLTLPFFGKKRAS